MFPKVTAFEVCVCVCTDKSPWKNEIRGLKYLKRSDWGHTDPASHTGTMKIFLLLTVCGWAGITQIWYTQYHNTAVPQTHSRSQVCYFSPCLFIHLFLLFNKNSCPGWWWQDCWRVRVPKELCALPSVSLHWVQLLWRDPSVQWVGALCSTLQNKVRKFSTNLGLQLVSLNFDGFKLSLKLRGIQAYSSGQWMSNISIMLHLAHKKTMSRDLVQTQMTWKSWNFVKSPHYHFMLTLFVWVPWSCLDGFNFPGQMWKYGWESTTSGSLMGQNSTLCLPSLSATLTIAPEHRTAISCWSNWVGRPLWTASCAPLPSPQSVPVRGRCARSLGGGAFVPAMRAVSYEVKYL